MKVSCVCGPVEEQVQSMRENLGTHLMSKSHEHPVMKATPAGGNKMITRTRTISLALTLQDDRHCVSARRRVSKSSTLLSLLVLGQRLRLACRRIGSGPQVRDHSLEHRGSHSIRAHLHCCTRTRLCGTEMTRIRR